MSSLKDLLAKNKPVVEPNVTTITGDENALVNNEVMKEETSSSEQETNGPHPPAPTGLGIKINLGKLGGLKANVQTSKDNTPIIVPKAEPVISKVQGDDFNHPGMDEKYSAGDINAIKDALDILRNSIDNSDLVVNATRNILISLKEHPEFVDILRPEDCQLMIRGLRESHGITVASKVANKDKKVKNAESIEAVGSMIGDIEFDIG